MNLISLWYSLYHINAAFILPTHSSLNDSIFIRHLNLCFISFVIKLVFNYSCYAVQFRFIEKLIRILFIFVIRILYFSFRDLRSISVWRSIFWMNHRHMNIVLKYLTIAARVIIITIIFWFPSVCVSVSQKTFSSNYSQDRQTEDLDMCLFWVQIKQ